MARRRLDAMAGARDAITKVELAELLAPYGVPAHLVQRIGDQLLVGTRARKALRAVQEAAMRVPADLLETAEESRG